MKVSRLLLDKLKVAVPKRVSRARLLDLTLYQRDGDFLLNEMLFSLEAYVLAHQIDGRRVSKWERVPATWWQHFKLDAIKWGNPFFDPDKVRYTRIELSTEYRVWATFPECWIDFPEELGKPVIWIMSSDETGKEW